MSDIHNEMQECAPEEYRRIYNKYKGRLGVFSSYSASLPYMPEMFTAWGIKGTESKLIASECDDYEMRRDDPEAWTYWKNSDLVESMGKEEALQADRDQWRERARGLEEALQAYTRFEAALITDRESWSGPTGHPFRTDELLDKFMGCQRLRNAALSTPTRAPAAPSDRERRLEEALKFYADPTAYDEQWERVADGVESHESRISQDKGYIARAALSHCPGCKYDPDDVPLDTLPCPFCHDGSQREARAALTGTTEGPPDLFSGAPIAAPGATPKPGEISWDDACEELKYRDGDDIDNERGAS